jgi:Ca2+-binding RTX toxin-like protein
VNNDFSRNITNDKYLNAGIDDLRIYSNVLSTNQVRSIWETETNHHDVGIANDGSSFQFDVTARAFDTLSVHGLQTGWTLTDGSGGHSVTITTGVTQSVDISTWNLDNPLTVNGVTANQSAMIDVTATKGIHQIDQVLNLVSITSAYEGTIANNTFAGTANSDFAFGNAGTDSLTGLAGDDRLDGGDGNDTLNGGAGSDLLIGGKGNDTLTGGLGADIFAWKLGDAGTIGAPAADTITDFDNSLRSPLGGDVLDLRDLLIGETAGTLLGQDNLSNYLHFEKNGANTVVHVSTNGGYAAGFNASLDVQTITLQNVDLVTGFGNDQAIIQDLLTKQKLITD